MLAGDSVNVNAETLRRFEEGKLMPSHNLVYAIAACGFVLNPKTGLPFAGDELSDIAAESLDPMTGEYVGCLPIDYRNWGHNLSIAILIQQHCLYLESVLKGRTFDTALNQLALDAGLDEEYLRQAHAGMLVSNVALAQLSRVLVKRDGQTKSCWNLAELEFLQSIQNREKTIEPQAYNTPFTVKSLLHQWVSRQARRWVLERCSQICDVSVEALEAIMSGERPKDEDLERLASHFIKPDGNTWTIEELQELRRCKFDLTEGGQASEAKSKKQPTSRKKTSSPRTGGKDRSSKSSRSR